MRRAHLVAAAVLSLLAGALAQAQNQQPFLSTIVRAQLVVADREAVARGLAVWADQAGGTALFQSADRVVLRVPAGRVEDCRRRLIEVAEAVAAYSPSASDQREERSRVDAGIASREESLRLVLQYLDEANVAGTLALEKEIATLVRGIEQLKGTRARLIYEAEYARVEVQLRSQTQTVPQRRPSAFGWINNVGLYSFLEASRER